MDHDEKRVRHLEAVLTVIDRLARNSFLIKGWAVVLLGGLFISRDKLKSWQFVILSMLLGLLFWILDGYYLRQERLFRALYNRVRLDSSPKSADFFSMNVAPFNREVTSLWGTMLSHTLWVFYGGAFIVVVTVLLIFF